MTTYYCVSVLEFANGTGQCKILHEGTKEECQEMVDTIPAIIYNEEPQPINSFMGVAEKEAFDRFLRERKADPTTAPGDESQPAAQE